MNKRTNAFTLVELSIVLVIIGLLLAGVLSAKQFINSAKQRTAIKWIEEFRSATTAFNDKYLALPGDYSLANPNLGTNSFTNGNGDSAIAANAFIFDGGNANHLSQETLNFWRHLYLANLIRQKIDHNNNDTRCYSKTNNNLPYLGIGRGGCVIAYTSPNDGLNYFHAGFIDSSGTNYTLTSKTSAGIFPIDALAIDVKMDDGNGKAGNIRTVATLSVDNLTPDANCINTTTGAYRLQNPNPDNYCLLRIRM